MTSARAELADLVAAVKALVADQQARGVAGEGADEPAPPADPALLAAWADDDAHDAAEPPEEAASADDAPAPAGRAAWDALAAATRDGARPTGHDDGVGAAGLAAIRADLGDCRRCGLCEGRRNVVFGVGDPDADLLVIGEGPGEQEDLSGEPFVGPAGQMLDKMLENVLGLSRDQVYIANVVKCRPPGNRNPSDEESATCKPFLLRQIAAIQPKVIVVLGSVALQQVLGLRGIKRTRGTEHKLGAVPAFPTFHPAYLLRVPGDKRLVFDDLKRIRARYDALGGRR